MKHPVEIGGSVQDHFLQAPKWSFQNVGYLVVSCFLGGRWGHDKDKTILESIVVSTY